MMTEFKRTQRDYPLSFKIAVVEQVEKGEMTYKQAQQRYGIQGRSTVLVWLRKYGRLDWRPGLPDLVKRKLPVAQTTIPLTPEQRIRELEEQLELANQMLTGQIKQFWLESGYVYGYRKIHLDLRDTGQQCGVNRVWRLMKRAGIKAQVGYRSPRARKGEDSIVAPDRLQRQFNPDAPDERWVTDITYIRTHEGWLYLAVVVDLFSRKVIGWSMQPRMTKEIVLNALLMALWRRNPQKAVLVHSDQGSQYTSYEWQSFLKSHGLEGSMSRRGNCHDNAVAESFFQLLKRERIKKKIYGTREEARSDIFDYIEMFYNSKRRHGSSDKMPPTEYENRYYRRLESV
ncbi:IS3 family transposase [Salmonella enterica]|nr:IS3 family transposase [Salmonella enterica]